MSPVILPAMQDGQNRPIKQAWSLGAVAHRESLPIPIMNQQGFSLSHGHPLATLWRLYPDRLIAGHRQHVRVAMSFQKDAQVQVAAVDRIGDDPCERDLRFPETLNHLSRQFTLGLKAHLLWNASLVAALRIVDPF